MADGWSGDRTAKSHKTNGTDYVKMLKTIERNAFNTVILLSVIAAMLACTVFAVSFSSVYYILICGTAGLAIFFLKKLRKGNGN